MLSLGGFQVLFNNTYILFIIHHILKRIRLLLRLHRVVALVCLFVKAHIISTAHFKA
jgi:hypothetical protein